MSITSHAIGFAGTTAAMVATIGVGMKASELIREEFPRRSRGASTAMGLGGLLAAQAGMAGAILGYGTSRPALIGASLVVAALGVGAATATMDE